MPITAYPPQISAGPARYVRAGVGALASAAGADGTLADLSTLSSAGALALPSPGDVITCVFNSTDPSIDYTSYFHTTVFDHSGTPALKQNQALPGGVQGQGCVALGVSS